MSLLASHARDKGGPDLILKYSTLAKKRAQEIGKENIIDATVGSFLDEDGTLMVMKTVEKALQEVSFSEGATYAPTLGEPEFLKVLEKSVFLDKKPKAFLGTVTTPGGTAALRNASFNYLELGERCITTDFYWSNYKNLLAENGRFLETFSTFDKKDRFNLEACLNTCQEVAKKQRNVMLLLNTPAHNPTGCELSYEEWESLVDGLKALSQNGKNNVILVVDVAYIDFAEEQSRDFFLLFEGLPENFLVIICTSMSKGYSLYGYRLGAMIALSQSQAVIDEFISANSASARATWSNSSRPAMMAICAIYGNRERLKAFRQEERYLANILKERATLFLDEAKALGLKLCPYQSGFFVTIPLESQEKAIKVADALVSKEVFVVPQGRGIRLAICAISKVRLKGLAKFIQDVIGEVK